MKRADTKGRITSCLVLPATVWMALLLLVPLAGMVVTGFLSRGADGEVVSPFTFENFLRFLGFGLLGYDPIHLEIFGRTVILGVVSTGCCAVVGLPLAFFIARSPPRARNILLACVIIPFWTNLLVRTYAWQILLAPGGLLASIAGCIFPGAEQTGLYPSHGAVLTGLVCDYLPYFVLPLYASVEQIDWRLYEAASDLGASPKRAFVLAVLPQVKPGLYAATVLVFIPSLGQFVIPDLLGGSKTILAGNAIAQQFGQSRDWPFGAVLATIQLCAALSVLVLIRRSKEVAR